MTDKLRAYEGGLVAHTTKSMIATHCHCANLGSYSHEGPYWSGDLGYGHEWVVYYEWSEEYQDWVPITPEPTIPWESCYDEAWTDYTGADGGTGGYHVPGVPPHIGFSYKSYQIPPGNPELYDVEGFICGRGYSVGFLTGRLKGLTLSNVKLSLNGTAYTSWTNCSVALRINDDVFADGGGYTHLEDVIGLGTQKTTTTISSSPLEFSLSDTDLNRSSVTDETWFLIYPQYSKPVFPGSGARDDKAGLDVTSVALNFDIDYA